MERERYISQEGKEVQWGQLFFRTWFCSLFITHLSLFSPKETKRQFLRAFYCSWTCPSTHSPSLSLVRVSRTLIQSEDWRPCPAGVSHGIFPGESWITPDKIFNNCCNSAGCWHCFHASAELKHSEVYFSYFIWVDSYNHKGSILNSRTVSILFEHIFFFFVQYSESLCMESPCEQTTTKNERPRVERLHRWPA